MGRVLLTSVMMIVALVAPLISSGGVLAYDCKGLQPVDFTVVNKIVQYGPPRTATTFQYRVLCIVALLKFPDQRVGCPGVMWVFDESIYDKFDVLVLKTHHPSGEKMPVHPSDTDYVMFSTSAAGSDGRGARPDLLREAGFSPAYTQEYDEFVRLDLAVLEDYGCIFDMSQEDMVILHEYMRYWEIMRRCCGSQSSKDWRNYLHNSTTPLKHGVGSYDKMDCLIYDLDQVESYLMGSTFVKRYPEFNIVADSDGVVKGGHFCRDTNEKIRQGFDFNGKKWDPAMGEGGW